MWSYYTVWNWNWNCFGKDTGIHKKWCLLWNFMHCLWVYVSVMNDFVCHIWDLNSLPSFNLTPTTERWSRRRPRAWTVSVCRLPEAIILIKISHFLIGKLLQFVNTFFLLHHKLRPSGEEFNLSTTGFWWLLATEGWVVMIGNAGHQQ